MAKIAIIGAGISGLSTAHLLKHRHDVTIFEKDTVPGGLIKCRRIEGSLFHTCGGHVFNSKRQDVLEWFWSIFSRENEFTKADRNSVVFLENGKHIPYPIENHMYLCDKDIQMRFISDLLDISKAQGTTPRNFEEFLKGRFGKTLYNLYFHPYNTKVWRTDLSTVPLTWLEGKLPMPTVEEMIYNNFNHIEEKNFVHATFWYEKQNGSQYIVDKLAQDLDIVLGVNINSIEYNKPNNKWLVCGKEFDTVIYCGNIKDMPFTIKGTEVIKKYSNQIDALAYHGTTAVFCEIDANPYSWIYQPSTLHQSHRIICTGNFSKTNNNKDITANRITATIEFTDEITKEEILNNLKNIPLNPSYLGHVYNQYTYPIQDNYTRDMIKSLKHELSPLNFFFTGRFADWEYYNMDIAIGAAMDMIKEYKL
ncbi:FAD-dependent oxidoreductase [uncultured Bacteroides sp.]|uniref:protoporphyrinogen/coproporphyrinogen oxidase n=1 Tax=uncultured Bacteroides sp. TaxID=162156 RepID=UPI00263222FC|nr:FAD-dependent oxidoreductase [uncultured Bacteroides sp.]